MPNKQPEKQSAVIISVTSDIGSALARRLLSDAWSVTGTLRTESDVSRELSGLGASLSCLDLSADTLESDAAALASQCPDWDVLVLSAGLLEPIGPFAEVSFDDWQKSVAVNFTQQLAVVHAMLPQRRLSSGTGPCVLFFAGGGANGAPSGNSAYTVSKIALTKMCELLDAEVPDTRFVIVGPGWVDTKIHKQTLAAGKLAGDSYRATIEHYEQGAFTAMDDVIDCCQWIFKSERKTVGGRNFSVACDQWGSTRLEQILAKEPGMYKLRRFGNDFLVKKATAGQDNSEQLDALKSAAFFERLFQALPVMPAQHAPTSAVFALMFDQAKEVVQEAFSSSRSVRQGFGPFGELVFPFHKMGTIDSLNLFELNELILFSFYWLNRTRYKNVADIGANIGLHSIILAKCGFAVHAYEPDPEHARLIERNLLLNDVQTIELHNAAVSDKAGVHEFVRVLGNTTGSHLSGAKANPYGQLERFPVKLEPIKPILAWADLVKMDVEGHERDILLSTDADDWESTDAFVEIGSVENAGEIFDHFSRLRVNMFSQKIGWKLVDNASEMPESYKDGSLFITSADKMPWVDS